MSFPEFFQNSSPKIGVGLFIAVSFILQDFSEISGIFPLNLSIFATQLLVRFPSMSNFLCVLLIKKDDNGFQQYHCDLSAGTDIQ